MASNFYKSYDAGVIGAGAAGFFGAIACADSSPNAKIFISEKMRQILSKVRVSGGGRCNVTHYCFDPTLLIKNYPRGAQALRGPFTRFQPKDTMAWFESRGVPLKVEEDGRVFPCSDQSESIIRCLTQTSQSLHIELFTECGIESIEKNNQGFILHTTKNTSIQCKHLLITSGSNPKMFDLLHKLGHKILSPVPSLFTFTIPQFAFHELAGISKAKVQVHIPEIGLRQTGPILITHWGFSGPAILKLSAWGARLLHQLGYKATLEINWLPDLNEEEAFQVLNEEKSKHSSKQMSSIPLFDFPKKLWREFIQKSHLDPEKKWADISKKEIRQFIKSLQANTHPIDGKSLNKEEFVTCGGVDLNEVNFKTMESRIVPGLFFAGEVLDIDGITGGFNFQNAWTTSWIAGNAIAERLNKEMDNALKKD